MNEEVQNITPDNDIEVKILDDQPKEQEDVSLVQPEENQPQESASDVNEELKSLKKKVNQMEAQREKVREWAHKAELLDAKKMKLKYKEILQELDRDET